MSSRRFFLSHFKSEQFIEIRSDDTFGDITTAVYFLISDYVSPYSYLESWALREKESGKFLVIREIGDFISALSIFRQIKEVEIIQLTKPYVASDSKDRVRS